MSFKKMLLVAEEDFRQLSKGEGSGGCRGNAKAPCMVKAVYSINQLNQNEVLRGDVHISACSNFVGG